MSNITISFKPFCTDYCNSGFILYNDILYIKNINDLKQFVSSVYHQYSEVQNKKLPPEINYLLCKEQLENHNKCCYKHLYKDKEEGIVWEWQEVEKDYSYYIDLELKRIILDQNKFHFNYLEYHTKYNQIATKLQEFHSKCNLWFIEAL